MLWFSEESPPGDKLYYQLILGAIPVDRATNELIRVFGNDEERNEREREKAAIAVVLLDRNGLLLEDNAVSISSFAWALPIALSGDLAGFGGWANVERGLIEGLTKQLARRDHDGNRLPVDDGAMNAAFRWLVETLGLPDGLYEAPSFALRVFHHFKAKGSPEPTLLNSFFLADLSHASELVESGRPGRALARYIGLEPMEHSPNLLEDFAGIEALVAPGKMPVARWPAPGGHPLAQPMPQVLADYLADFIKGAAPDAYLFPSTRSKRGRVYQINGQFGRCVIRAGLDPGATPHTRCDTHGHKRGPRRR